MKMGLSVWSVPPDWPLAKTFAAAKAAGFDGVEVALDETGEVNLNSTEEDMRKIKALAESAGIELYSLATGLYWTYSLTSDDEKIRAKAKEILAKQLQTAAWLGCDTILVVPGAVGVDFIENCPVVPYDAAYGRALEAIREAKPLAERLGVTIGLENVWNKFLLSPLEMRDFIDKCESGFVGAYFDAGNVVQTGYPEHWIKILGKRIKKAHFKDFRRAAGNMSGFVDMLSGDVDYPAVMKAFAETGYDGWVTAEVGFSAGYPKAGVENVANAMQYILGRKK
jgi:hexulose-6-phosphate isomerase